MKKARIKSSLLFWNELERLKSSPYPQHKEGVGFAHAPFRRRGNTMDSDVRDGGPGEPWAPWEKRVSYRVTLPRRLKKTGSRSPSWWGLTGGHKAAVWNCPCAPPLCPTVSMSTAALRSHSCISPFMPLFVRGGPPKNSASYWWVATQKKVNKTRSLPLGEWTH